MIRRALPDADPYLFPLAAALAAIGIVMLYRINPTLARQQAQWMIVGLVLFAITIVAYRGGRYLQLENYRYLIAIFGLGSMILPRLPGIGGQVNGAYLAVHVGAISFQPSELGKIALVIFLASYLRDNRQVLVTAGRRVLGVTIPPMKQFGPLLLVWGSAMALLLVTREIGTSLMFFAAFLALLYVATGRVSFPLVGLLLFAAGAYYLGTHVAHIHAARDGVGASLRAARSTTRTAALPARQRPVRPGRRRAARRRLRPVADRRPAAGRRERLDLRGDHRRDRAGRRGRRCCSPTCCSSPAA